MRKFFVADGGFCFGVRSVIEKCNKALLNSKVTGKIYSYGDIIHNKIVTEKFVKKGLAVVDSTNDIKTNDTVIIRAHGVSPVVFNELREKKATVLDGTCPFVKKIHKIVLKHSMDGFFVIIVGKNGHPEVEGIKGWCHNGYFVVENEYDLMRIPKANKYCVVSQTTNSIELYKDITKKIFLYVSKKVEFFDTICYTTLRRQNIAKKLSTMCTKIFVLGSKTSANTNKLFSICSEKCDAYLLDTLQDAKKIKYDTDETVGIVAGASTPDEFILEVVNYMVGDKEFSEVSQAFIDALNENMVEYKVGKMAKGTVISADENGISVNLGGKLDGIIKSEDAELDGVYDPANYPVGKKIEAKVISTKDNDTGCVLLSKKQLDMARFGDAEVNALRDGREFALKIEQDVKGGVRGRIGSYSVFVPSSQISENYTKDMKQFVGQTFRVVAIDFKDDERQIIASQRKILAGERKEQEAVFWQHVEPMMKVAGVVKRFATFGAFISVGGVDCLAHITDLSWSKINKPEDVLTLGETYEFVVLSIDKEKNRVSLGYKQLQDSPWERALEKYTVGSEHKGKVQRLVSYGAFVELEKGIDGLVHVSEAAYGFIKNIADILKIGDEVDVKILGIDIDNHRINLSIKATQPVPEGMDIVSNDSSAEEIEQNSYKDDSSNNVFASLLKK